MIHAASRRALADLLERIGSATSDVKGKDLPELARELYAVAGVLDAEPLLRRRLADPTTDPQRRTDLAQRLFEGRISPAATELVRDAVALRWSSAWDLLDALETAGDESVLAAAEQGKVLDEVEDELFRFGRILDSDSRLTALLDDRTASVQRRTELVGRLVEGKVNPLTQQALEHAVTSQRRASITTSIDALLDLAAARRNRSMARVVSAAPLSEKQQSRLATALSQMYGRAITIRAAVDPDVLGGLVVRVGDEVIDGSVAARLADVKAHLEH